MERRGQRLARKTAAVLVLLMAIGLIQDRVRLLSDGVSSLQWPTVVGTVIDAEAEQIAGARAGPGWRIYVDYRYEVNGREYRADRLRFTRRLGGRTRTQAADELLQYVPEGPVLVYYNPRRPERAVIEPGPDPRAWFGLAVGVLLLVVAAVFWIVPTRSTRRLLPDRRISGRPGRASSKALETDRRSGRDA